jgi:AraC family transcriptional regulator
MGLRPSHRGTSLAEKVAPNSPGPALAKCAKTVKHGGQSGGIIGDKEVAMRPATEQTYHERILRVLVYIQEHLDEVLPLEDLARVARFAPHHFHRIFGAMVGESVKEHIRRLRLERAAHRLQFGRLPVTAIAFEAGYETHESFTRAFRAMFGTPPSRYRRRQRPRSPAPAPSGVHYLPEGRLTAFHPVYRGGPPMDVRLETLSPMPVAFLRHVGPYEDEALTQTWEKLLSWARPRGLLGPRTLRIGISYDNPHVTPPDKLRYDACVTTDRPVPPEGEVGVQEIAGGEYAVVTHRGPYEKLTETYAQLYGDWLPNSGREPADMHGFVILRRGPRDTAPQDLVTDICVPLKPR